MASPNGQFNLDPAPTERESFTLTTCEEEQSKESVRATKKPDSPDKSPPKSDKPSVFRSKKTWKELRQREPSMESSHTKFYKKDRIDKEYKQVTRKQYLSISDSMSGSSDTFQCLHGPEGKEYTEKGLLKRNIVKNLDPIRLDPKWREECPSTFKWEMAEKLAYMVQSPTVVVQMERLKSHLRDFAKTSSEGYRVDTLKSFCIIIDYLMEEGYHNPTLKEERTMLLENLKKPIILTASADVWKYFEMIMDFLGYIGYLLIKIEDDKLFDVVSKAIIWHLSAPDDIRGPGTVALRYSLLAGAPVLRETTVRMLAVASSHRFPTFLEIALLLACDTVENCIEMMKENIIENIFYRFNPYFPEKDLPNYDINPWDCQDPNLKLGDSSVNMTTTLSLLLVLVKTTKQYLDENPSFRKVLPYPDCYAQRCFIWAYRYECRTREHRHERTTLTVIAAVLTKCFGDKLRLFSSILMPDVMSLSVLTELPPRDDWTATINFNTFQQDVQFKKVLIYFVVDLLKAFPYNKFMVVSQHWLLGIMYLLDPGLCSLRSRWSPPLFAELRKTALQALVCTIPLCDRKLVKQYGLIRRLMWYIEWYSEKPYELPVLYWCVRLLQVATLHSRDPERRVVMQDLFNTHGIIILIHLCYTLMEQKLPPVERSQAVIALALRLLTSGVIANKKVSCCVYPNIKWPKSANALAKKMLEVVLYSLDKHFIVSDRWLISLLNFIWEAIVWRPEYRAQFVANDGIYKLLDMITMTRPPVQCIALALVCDITRAGDAVGQLVSWRAHLGASNANPTVVKRGATIASLLAAVFRESCRSSGVKLNEYGVIQDLECPIVSLEARNAVGKIDELARSHSTPECPAAADMAGSCMPKAFAILHMLSEDLEHRVALADEAYNLYENIKLAMEDEVILVLVSHYLTLKLAEVWRETKLQSVEIFAKDDILLDDFLAVGRGWAKEIKRQQEDVFARDKKKEREEECSLYSFLGRIRLNIALDALRAVRCVSRSTDRHRVTHALIHDAVFAHHRRSVFAKKTNTSLLRTFNPPLDDQNITGQNVKIRSIHPPNVPKALVHGSSTGSQASE
ncbi:uncharacterized protein LOC124645124 [Helicoverpa zea]|uniref:uncharacterized protein LOC124645124 n=1 Tax=Helicoverpa zea TaxID=7113 RepID=UPI001F59DEB1|nr:uncharacterized protein LOC124645124 [Helicoverpa zea]